MIHVYWYSILSRKSQRVWETATVSGSQVGRPVGRAVSTLSGFGIRPFDYFVKLTDCYRAAETETASQTEVASAHQQLAPSVSRKKSLTRQVKRRRV
jgi:hypothetical protein